MMKTKIKAVRLKNIFSKDVFVCDDYNKVKIVDGVEFVEVHKEAEARKFLMNKNMLVKLKTGTS